MRIENKLWDQPAIFDLPLPSLNVTIGSIKIAVTPGEYEMYYENDSNLKDLK